MLASSASSAPALTAADVTHLKLAAMRTRLAHLWAAAHSPLAYLAPRITAHYLREMRILAAHSDIQLDTAATQLNYCSQCSTPRLPGVSARVRIEPSADQKRRERKGAKQRMKRGEERAKQHAAAAVPAAKGATVAAPVPPATRKRARVDTSSRGASPSPSAVTPTLPTHSIASTCLHCGQCDRVAGTTARQRALLECADTDIASLFADHSALVAHQAAASSLASSRRSRRSGRRLCRRCSHRRPYSARCSRR
jgi:RNase P subunit RPR2